MATEQKRMRQLVDTEAAWASADPTLLSGELALSSDVQKFKVGPGQWSTLSYWEDGGGASGDYLPLSGGTMTGPLRFDWTQPSIEFYEADQPVDQRLWDVIANSGVLGFTPRNDNASSQIGIFQLTRGTLGLTDVGFSLSENADTLPEGRSAVNRDRGDNRYVQLSGGTMTGDLILSEPSPSLQWNEDDAGTNLKNWIMFSGSSILKIQARDDGGSSLTGG